MRRLHAAALAAFLISAGAGVAHAAYFANCAMSNITGQITVLNIPKTFDIGGGANCGGGTAACCMQLESDVEFSGDGGATWHPYTHKVKVGGINCNTTGGAVTDSIAVTAGWYRCTSSVQDCSGNILKNLGTNTHQF